MSTQQMSIKQHQVERTKLMRKPKSMSAHQMSTQLLPVYVAVKV